MIILEENFKWHLEAFASELFIFSRSNIDIDIFVNFCNNIKTIDHKDRLKVGYITVSH